jgi:pSer/pThr/pTyr-binding forkhead associated (FHA) protein
MIVCPNCNHNNPAGATQCEACFTPLPQLVVCPHCGVKVQEDVVFCGNCGQDINLPAVASPQEPEPTAAEATPAVQEAESTPPVIGATQLQSLRTKLFHVQTQTTLELPQGLNIIHIGKPNDHIPPDIDVSGFAHADVVSRMHADLRLEGDAYYLEDVGSSNGTYVNHSPLLPGNRHRLRAGDRISLGKGDLVTFIFQTEA